MATRITGGKARGIHLKVPPGNKTRPATDYMRQALFSSLGEKVSHRIFLDMFAGTGGYGLEALSRGAQGGLFLEKDRKAILSLQENIRAVAKSLKLKDIPCQIKSGDTFLWQPKIDQKFGLIFIDPPYALLRIRGQELLEKAKACLENKEGSTIIVEMPGDMTPLESEGLYMSRQLGSKTTNDPALVFYMLKN